MFPFFARRKRHLPRCIDHMNGAGLQHIRQFHNPFGLFGLKIFSSPDQCSFSVLIELKYWLKVSACHNEGPFWYMSCVIGCINDIYVIVSHHLHQWQICHCVTSSPTTSPICWTSCPILNLTYILFYKVMFFHYNVVVWKVNGVVHIYISNVHWLVRKLYVLTYFSLFFLHRCLENVSMNMS